MEHQEIDRILLVSKDDNDHGLYDILKGTHYEVTPYSDPQKAFFEILQHPYDYFTILISFNIGYNETIELIKKITACDCLKFLPVIIETADNEISHTKQILKSIDEGAKYCLKSPIVKTLTLNILNSALNDKAHHIHHAKSVNHKEINIVQSLDNATFKFKSLQEGFEIAKFISEACPCPNLAIVGLTEIIVNAIEHGNLGITYDDKSRLHDINGWQDEVNNLLQLEQNKDKYVTLTFRKETSKIIIKIEDQGEGFDWNNYLEVGDERILDTHGRGISISKKLSFSNLSYVGKGNIVVCEIDIQN